MPPRKKTAPERSRSLGRLGHKVAHIDQTLVNRLVSDFFVLNVTRKTKTKGRLKLRLSMLSSLASVES